MRTGIATVAVLLCLGAAHEPVPASAQVPANTATPVSPQRALIEQYCLGCHSDRLKSGRLATMSRALEALEAMKLPRK
jgi:cytochrome c553